MKKFSILIKLYFRTTKNAENGFNLILRHQTQTFHFKVLSSVFLTFFFRRIFWKCFSNLPECLKNFFQNFHFLKKIFFGIFFNLVYKLVLARNLLFGMFFQFFQNFEKIYEKNEKILPYFFPNFLEKFKKNSRKLKKTSFLISRWFSFKTKDFYLIC